MQEIYKKVDFKYLDKSFLNKYDIKVSNLGNIKKNDVIISLTKRNKKRLVFTLSHNKKRYDIGVASLVAIVFLDNHFNQYDISFRDNDSLNCKLSNIDIVYRHEFREKDNEVLDLFTRIDYLKLKRLFFKMIYKKNIRYKNYCSIDDYFQEYLMFCFNRLDLYDKRKNKDIYQYCLSRFQEWFNKTIRKKIVIEKFDYISIDKLIYNYEYFNDNLY